MVEYICIKPYQGSITFDMQYGFVSLETIWVEYLGTVPNSHLLFVSNLPHGQPLPFAICWSGRLSILVLDSITQPQLQIAISEPGVLQSCEQYGECDLPLCPQTFTFTDRLRHWRSGTSSATVAKDEYAFVAQNVSVPTPVELCPCPYQNPYPQP